MLRLFTLLSVLVFTAPAFAHVGDQRPELDSVRIEERLGGQLPLDTKFTDETGQTVELSRYFNGKPALLVFVYYDCPQLCPLVLEGLARTSRVLRLAGDDYQVIAVSIDPAETPKLAAQAKGKTNVGAGWHFLTGTSGAIAALTQAAGFSYRAVETRGKEEFIHPANTIVVTPEGKISRYFSTIDFPPKDLRFALIEASGNRIGSPLDHLIMLCYRYDPAQGRYTLAVLNTLRVGAIFTVAVLASFIGFMLLRERQRTT